MKCVECNHDFPDHLISELTVSENGKVHRGKMCPICALKILNELSRLPPGTPFQGPNAQKMLEEARQFLKGKCENEVF